MDSFECWNCKRTGPTGEYGPGRLGGRLLCLNCYWWEIGPPRAAEWCERHGTDEWRVARDARAFLDAERLGVLM
jgi:hypothetical protein